MRKLTDSLTLNSLVTLNWLVLYQLDCVSVHLMMNWTAAISYQSFMSWGERVLMCHLLQLITWITCTIANVTIHTYLKHTKSCLGEGQSIQVTRDACTNLTFSIYSHYASEESIFFPEGPCRNAKGSLSRVYVSFTPCLCPIGFQNDSNHWQEDDCVCVCDVRLSPYFTEAVIFKLNPKVPSPY